MSKFINQLNNQKVHPATTQPHACNPFLELSAIGHDDYPEANRWHIQELLEFDDSLLDDVNGWLSDCEL